MVYANQFHRLVMIGDLYADIFNVTLAFAPTPGPTIPPVTQALLDGVAGVVEAWWDNPLASAPGNGLTIDGAAKLKSVKLNRIGVDGTYQDPLTMEKVFAAPVVGGGASGGVPQLSLVATLRGTDTRGAAAKGRMYWPVSQACKNALDTAGKVTQATALQHAHGTANLIRLLNSAYNAAGVNAVAVIASRTGAGRFQVVDNVTVGRVVDTMRSRRNKLTELPEVADV